SRQLAVALEAAYRVVHVAIVGTIGQALFLEPRNDVEHVADMLCGTRLVIWRLHPQGPLVGVHGVDEERGHFTQTLAGFDRAANNLVVDIGDVAHIGDPIPRSAQPALNDIETDQHTGMAQMAEVVHRHAANIHADMPRLYGAQGFLATREGIVDMQHLPFLYRTEGKPGPAACMPHGMGGQAKARLKWRSLSIARPTQEPCPCAHCLPRIPGPPWWRPLPHYCACTRPCLRPPRMRSPRLPPRHPTATASFLKNAPKKRAGRAWPACSNRSSRRSIPACR